MIKCYRCILFTSLAVVMGQALGDRAWGGFIDFGTIPGGGHSPSLSYAGGNAPLVGTDLFVNNVLGESTPLNAGTLLNSQARMDFMTGNLVAATATSWEFGPGGSFTIVGTVPGVDNSSTTLISATFTGDSTLLDLGLGGFKVVGGGLVATIDPTLAADYGMPTAGVYLGAISLLFQGPGTSPGAFLDTNLNSGNLAFTSVPEPASWTLMCLAVLCLGFGRVFVARYVNVRRPGHDPVPGRGRKDATLLA